MKRKALSTSREIVCIAMRVAIATPGVCAWFSVRIVFGNSLVQQID